MVQCLDFQLELIHMDAFPSAGIFNQNTFYGLILPTEDVVGITST